MLVEPLADSSLGGPADDFVLVRWRAEVGGHWIAPLRVHHEDGEAWHVLSGTLELRLGDETVVARAGAAVLARKGTPHSQRLDVKPTPSGGVSG